MSAFPDPKATHLLEAILLVSPRPVGHDVLSHATGLNEPQITGAVAALEEKYSAGGSGIVLRHVAGGYQLATNPACAAVVERFREETRPTPLSNAANEVLSCALYMGPLTRAAISGIRGVNSDAVVRNLLERGLLAETGTDNDSPGSPALLDITEEFLSAAGAASRQDFPALDSLVNEEEIARVHERLGRARETPAPDLPEEGG